MKMPTGGGNPTAGGTDTDSLSVAEGNDNKRLQAMRSAHALRGHSPCRTELAHGPATDWVERWGLVRYAPSLGHVCILLLQIGGRV